jgi:hypothetical protein
LSLFSFYREKEIFETNEKFVGKLEKWVWFGPFLSLGKFKKFFFYFIEKVKKFPYSSCPFGRCRKK